MKFIVALASSVMCAAPAGASVTLYTAYSSGAGNGWSQSTYYAATGVQYVADTLAYAVQTGPNLVTGYGNGNGFADWANWTAISTGTGLALSGTYGLDQTMTATPAGSSIVVSFLNTPSNPQHGIMGAGIAYQVSGSVSGTVTVAFAGGVTSTLSVPASGSGFIGVWNQNPVVGSDWTRISTIVLTTSGSGTLTIDTIYLGYVPAPGVLALLGAAGLTVPSGRSRRRSG